MNYQPADIFFIAGEASGDLQASLLSRRVQALRPGTRVAGIAGDKLAATGAQIAYHSPEIASIGPLSVIPMIPLLYGIFLSLDRNIRARPPAVLAPVDIGGFNIPLLRRMRRRGYQGRVLYYFPPGAWVDNERQARAVGSLSLPLTPFAHQRDFYRSLGLPVEYFGHPLVSVIAPRPLLTGSALPQIAILPGSRREEAMRHVPVLARAASELAKSGVGFTLVASSARRAQQLERLWHRHGGPDGSTISQEPAVKVLAGVTAAWVASGTAVLEAALLEVPQVAFYTISPAQYRIAQRKLAPHLLRTITLPNLVLGRTIVTELLQADFTVANLVRETTTLLNDTNAERAQRDGYAELRRALGPPDSLQRIGAFVAELIDDARSSSA